MTCNKEKSMARLQLNKSSLATQSKSLRTFQRFLPSLDLKRKQLMSQRSQARQAVADNCNTINEIEEHVANTMPMLANEEVIVEDLIVLKKIEIGMENLVGTQLPTLLMVEIETKPYSMMSLPHWVDNAVAQLKTVLELKMKLKVNIRRLELLDAAVNTITQRVNLFEKVLIPQTRENIKRIKIYLSDEQMAAVVRSKIAKRKRQNTVSL